MAKEHSASEKAIASIPQAVRTVNISVMISLISLAIAVFTLFWSVRPASVEPLMSAVFISRDGGTHISIPMSFVNRGAQSTAVVAAKLYESGAGGNLVWGADFTAEPDKAITAITGALGPTNSSLWVPIVIPANGEVERVLIFRPQTERDDQLAASNSKVLYKVVLLLADAKEIETSTYITWPDITNAVLRQGKGGVGSMGADLDRWIKQADPKPKP
ncbi:MAG TPA: hypothetical protein VFF60_10940 [Candidatus Binatus sp.]|nr:hypothetical protein [Candidatus Binatus sp.]